EYDATILARAGLDRLGLSDRISFVLDAEQFVPAPAQGALAVQCRSDDAELIELLQAINHAPTAAAVGAERRVLSALHPGCHAPVGVHALLTGDVIAITAFVADVMAVQVIKETAAGKADAAVDVADTLIAKLNEAGVEKILEGYQTNE
ncbi:MAG: hydroxymethylbilane synthase, partial [Planctomycetota bacterium]